MRAASFVTIGIFAWVAAAQSPADQNVDKTFHFTYIDTPVAAQELSNAARIVTDIGMAMVDNNAKTVTMRGTANQIALAGWLFPQLDRPDAGQAVSAASKDPATLEYRLNGSSDAVARVFTLTNTPAPRDAQEIVNAVRSILEVQRIAVVNRTKSVVLRGNEVQVAAAAWLIGVLDQPDATDGASRKTLEYVLPNVRTSDPVTNPARVFYLNETKTPQGIQEIVNSVRSLADLQRVVAFNGARAIITRGTPDQVAMAAWLINLLDKPAQTQTTANNEYRPQGSSDVSRVFYVTHNATPQGLQDLLKQVRSTTNVQRATLCSGPGALALRGTEGQVAMADKLIQEKDRPERR